MENLSLTAAFTTKASDTEDDTLVIKGMANTVAKDRAGDVIVAEAWTTSNALTNYMKNPIVLAFHNHSLPIGSVVKITPTALGLEVEAEISKAAGHVYDLIRDGVLKTFSVGFRCLDADYDDSTGIFIIKDVELHEISVVSVPCNQESTFQVAKSLTAHDYREFKKQVTTVEQEALVYSPIEKLAFVLGIKELK